MLLLLLLVILLQLPLLAMGPGRHYRLQQPPLLLLSLPLLLCQKVVLQRSCLEVVGSH